MYARLCRLGQLRPLVEDFLVLPLATNRGAAALLLANAAPLSHLHTAPTRTAAHDDGFGEWDKKQRVIFFFYANFQWNRFFFCAKLCGLTLWRSSY